MSAINNILITGADGFIGQHVFRRFKAAKYSPVGISANGGKFDGEKIFKLNLLQEQIVKRFFQQHRFTTVIHLAARVPKNNQEANQKLALKENTVSTLNLLEAFSVSRAEKFIYASGISVVAQPDSLYVLSKYFGELLCQHFQAKFRKKVTILRISAPYGPGLSNNNVIAKFCQSALKNKKIEIYGTGRRSQDFVYVDDVAEAFFRAVKGNRPGIYNIGSGQTTSTLKLAKIILKNIPESRSKIVFFGKDPQENYRLHLDISKAKKDLEYQPKTSIEEGIKKYVENCRNL